MYTVGVHLSEGEGSMGIGLREGEGKGRILASADLYVCAYCSDFFHDHVTTTLFNHIHGSIRLSGSSCNYPPTACMKQMVSTIM